MFHGWKADAKPSGARGSFKCIVCKRPVNPGDWVVGFRNFNKPAHVGWDHVHAQPCADQYVVPPQNAVGTAPTLHAPQSASSSSQDTGPSSSGGAPQPTHPQDNTKANFFKMAASLSYTQAQAGAFLQQANGDHMEATTLMGNHYVATTFDDDDEGGAQTGNGNGSDHHSMDEVDEEAMSDDDEVLPVPAPLPHPTALNCPSPLSEWSLTPELSAPCPFELVPHPPFPLVAWYFDYRAWSAWLSPNTPPTQPPHSPSEALPELPPSSPPRKTRYGPRPLASRPTTPVLQLQICSSSSSSPFCPSLKRTAPSRTATPHSWTCCWSRPSPSLFLGSRGWPICLGRLRDGAPSPCGGYALGLDWKLQVHRPLSCPAANP